MSLWVFILPCVVWAAGNEIAWYAPSTKFVAKTDVEALPKTAIDLCTLPPDIGGCTKELIRYYYDDKQDDCRRFIFTGCGGNSNRFMRRAHCRNRCVKDKTKIVPKDDVITRVPAIVHNNVHHEKESKPHRRTLTTPPPPNEPPTTSTTTTRSTMAPPLTKATVRFHATETPIAIRQCPHCDPLFGVCIDGECGCIKGFKKLGRICIDIDECRAEKSPCPANTFCENTVGSFKCDCASGYQKGGNCEMVKEACDDEFDMNLAEEDCNNGIQLVRYFLDKESNTCKEFFYGGCRSRSRNIFENLETCQQLCAHKSAEGPLKPNKQELTTVKSVSHTLEDSDTASVSFDTGRPTDVEEDKSKVSGYIGNSGIPEKFRIDLTEPSPTPVLNSAEKQVEVKKVEEIISEITPELDPCQIDFDEVLRLECMTASWDERFYWNRDLDECEPFWYDSSCDPKETVGRNFYSSYEACQQRCNTGTEEPTVAYKVQESGSENSNATPVLDVDNQSTMHPLHYLNDVEEPLEETTTASNLLHEQVKTENTDNWEIEHSQPKKIFIDAEDPMGLLKRVPTTTPTAKPSTTTEFSLPPPHSSNFVTTAPLVLFDRAKYMAEFKKKLMELPTGRTTPATSGGLSFSGLGVLITKNRPLFTLPPSALGVYEAVEATIKPTEPTQEAFVNIPLNSVSKPVVFEAKNDIHSQIVEGNNIFIKLDEKTTRRPPFTLPSYVFEKEQQTTSTTSVYENLDKTKYETVEKQEPKIFVDEIRQIEQANQPTFETVPYKLQTTPAPLDFVTQEKNKIESTINEMNRLPDLCDEPLHPTLEEDCMNEQWVIRWFFNADRGSCKTFWYGGCPTDARNFFRDSANCKAACAHKMPVPESALRPKYITNPLSTQTPQTTVPRKNIPVVAVLPPYRNQNEGSQDSNSITAPDHDLPIFVPIVEETTMTDTTTEQAPTTTAKPDFEMTTTTTEIPFISYETSQAVVSDENVSPMDSDTKQEPVVVQKGSIRTTTDICSLGYDEKWDEDCSGDNWEVKSYYDPKAKKCKKFWWGGCMTDNQNVWKDQQTCIEMCMQPESTSPPPINPSPHHGTPRLIRGNAAGSDTQLTQERTDTQQNSEQPSTMIISQSLLTDDSQYSSISELNRIELDVPNKAQKERPLSDEASHEWHASPHRPRRKFSLKVRAALVETKYNNRRRDKHFNYDRNALETRDAASEGDWRLMNDAPATDDYPEVKASEVLEATGPAFEANLQRQLADVKRTHEDRLEFKYSNQHHHPVTVACTFIAIVLFML